MMLVPVYSVVLLSLIACNHVRSYPFGNNDQWSRFGMMSGHQQGYNNRGGQSGNVFGQGGGYLQNRGGQQRQSDVYTQGAEAYQSHIFNEPDRYGYDYTIPGATVHYLMHKKQGNRASGSYGGNDNGWNKRY